MSRLACSRVRRGKGASRLYRKGGRWSICKPCAANHAKIRAYQDRVCPSDAMSWDDWRASHRYLWGSICWIRWRYVTVWKRASTTIGPAASYARIISCGTEGLLRIMREIIITWGLSILRHPSSDTSGPHKGAPYIKAGVTRVSNSQCLVLGS